MFKFKNLQSKSQVNNNSESNNDSKKNKTKEELREEKIKTKKMFKETIKFVMKAKYSILAFIFFELFESALGVYSPIVEGHLIDSLSSLNFADIKMYIFILLGVTILALTSAYISNILWSKNIRNKVSYEIRQMMIDNVADISVKTFDQKSTGMFQSRINNDSVQLLEHCQTFVAYITNILGDAGVFVYVFVINKPICFLFAFGIIVNFFINKLSEDKTIALRKNTKDKDEKVKSVLTEFIRGIREIKVLNIKQKAKNDVKFAIKERDNALIKSSVFRLSIFRVTRFVCEGIIIASLFMGLHYIKLGTLTTASLITIYLYSHRVLAISNLLNGMITRFNDLKLSMERVFSFNDINEFAREKFGDKEINDIKGDIKFDNVTFGYTDKNVLKNFSIDIKANERIALVGSSGSGKSTILSLLTKSYDIEEGNGTIKIDGIDIKEFDEKSLRSNISIITQSPYIFNMSIRDNLKLVKDDATDEELISVCKKACLYEYINSLPNGLDELIGEGGLNLSGGQRQRLAIARALLKNSKILLFDEATSALDNITQKEIQKSIDNLSTDYTIIIVAHRLSTIKNVDKIYMIKDGKIECSGTHDDLLLNESYNSLYEGELV